MIKTRLVGLLSQSKKYIAFTVLWQWIALLGQILAVFSMAGLLEQAASGTLTRQRAGGTGLVLALAVLLRFWCDRLGARSSYLACADVKRILREKIYEKMLRLGASYSQQVSSSEVVQGSTEGVEQLETYFGKYLPQLFYSLLAPLTLFAVLSPVSLRASGILLLCVPLIPISIVAVQKIAKKLLDRYWSVYTELGDSFLENLQGLTTLKIYQADQLKAEQMDRESQTFRRITMKVLTMQLNSTSVMDVVAYGGAAVGMAAAVTEFLRGTLSLAGALSVVLLASEFFLPLRLLGSYFHIAMNGMAASDKIFRILDLPEPEDGEKTLPDGPLDVVLQDVHFSYEADREILHGVTVSFPEGSFTAIVGESGCGKSTLASLLMGRNRVFSGSLTVGGVPITELSESSLMEHFTYVSHQSYLFKGTVRDNLLMARPDADDAALWQVLEQVKLASFLRSQQGLDTILQEKGGNFSGGQCQRLALARALLHDSPVYIFDEATSNIDVESENEIMAQIHALAKTKTVILISHRLVNVAGADNIYVLDRGTVVEHGTHRALLAENGTYAKLWQSQQELEKMTKGGDAE